MATRKRPILKKRTTQEQKEDLESLLVFGYECKLFKDDEKAEYIEHGNHLIPWMGDNTVMIDRSVDYGAFGDLNLPEKGFDLQFRFAIHMFALRSVISSSYRQFMEMCCTEDVGQLNKTRSVVKWESARSTHPVRHVT